MHTVINHIRLEGAAATIAATRTRLLCNNAHSPLAGYICSVVEDEPGMLWLSYESPEVPTMDQTLALADCARGLVLQHLYVEPQRSSGESRVCFCEPQVIEVATLSPEECLRCPAVTPRPAVFEQSDDLTVIGIGPISGEVAAWIGRRKAAK